MDYQMFTDRPAIHLIMIIGTQAHLNNLTVAKLQFIAASNKHDIRRKS
jgi:hypothetical protein